MRLDTTYITNNVGEQGMFTNRGPESRSNWLKPTLCGMLLAWERKRERIVSG
jgi:hypothetical protein